MLSILTTGESWYNRLGYICENQDKIYSNNKPIIQMSFNDFIYKLEEKLKKNDLLKFKTLINLLEQNEIVNLESTVQDVFIKIKEMLKPGQPCREIEPKLLLLIDYIMISKILKITTEEHIKILQPDGKGMQRIKRKGSKSKRKKGTKRIKRKKGTIRHRIL